MWFQRVEEVIEDSRDQSIGIAEAYSQMGNMQPEIQASKKRKRVSASENEEEEDIRAFQRVRLLLQSAGTRKQENSTLTWPRKHLSHDFINNHTADAQNLHHQAVKRQHFSDDLPYDDISKFDTSTSTADNVWHYLYSVNSNKE
jgi:hypothetical protein